MNHFYEATEAVEYQAPQIEEVLTAETLEREVAYAGVISISNVSA